jgi:hypothetical protein
MIAYIPMAGIITYGDLIFIFATIRRAIRAMQHKGTTTTSNVHHPTHPEILAVFLKAGDHQACLPWSDCTWHNACAMTYNNA